MNLNVVRLLTIRSKAEGVAETTAALKDLTSAQDGVAKSAASQATVTDSQAKRQLSLADAVSKAERQFVQGVRAQQDFEKLQRRMNDAVAQNPALQERVNTVLAAARGHYDAAGKGAISHSAAMQEASNQATALASRLGPLGIILTSIGPGGIAAAAGIGLLIVAFNTASEATHKFADDMGKLRDNAEAFRLTTLQLQAINDEGSKFALTEEKIGSALQRFTAGMEDVRRGTGDMFNLIRRIDPALAAEMAQARGTAQAIDVLAKVYEKAGAARSQLDRMIGGRQGGAAVGALFQSIGQQGGVDKLTEDFRKSGDAIDDNIIKKVAFLKREIDDMAQDASRNFASIFSVQLLEREKSFVENWREISRIAREFKLSDDASKWLAVLARGALAIIPGASAIVAGVNAATTSRQTFSGASSVDEAGFGNAASSVIAARNRENNRAALELEINTQKARITAMGDAATSAQQLAQRERELKLALTDNIVNLADYRKALDVARLSEEQQGLQARIGLLGVMASVEEKVVASANAIALARAKGVSISDDESRAIINLTRNLAEAATAEGRMKDARDNLFKSQAQQDIDKVLLQNGIPPESARGKAIADYMRMTDVLKQIKDISDQALSGFLKDIANGVKPMEALANASKRVAESLIDIASKQIVTAGLGSLFGDTAALSTGAASAGTILTTAGATVAASIVAGATEAAGILGLTIPVASAALPVAGAATGVEVAAGGAAAGTALAVGGAAAGAAIWGPIALLIAAVAAIGAATLFGGKKESPWEATLRQAKDAFAKMTDEVNDFVTAARGFDLSPVAKNLRDIVNEAGRLMDAARAAGDVGAQARINAAYGQQLIRTITDFINPQTELGDLASRIRDVQRSAEDLIQQFILMGNGSDLLAKALRDGAGKQIEALRHQAELSVQASINDAQGKGFINQMNDLLAKIADLQSSGVSQQLLNTDLAVEAQAIVDSANLTGDAFNELLTLFPNLTGVVHESTSALQDQIDAQRRLQEQVNSAVRGIVDFVNSFRVGPESTLSPSARLAQAQSTFNAQYALAQGGNIDALDSITKYSDDLIKALRDNKASGASGEIDHILNQLLTLPAVTGSTDPVVLALKQIAGHQEAVFFDDMADSAVQTLAQAQTQTSLLQQILATLGQLNLISITIAEGVGATAAATAAQERARQEAEAAAAAAAQAAAALALQNALDQQRYNLAMTQYLAYADQEQWSLQEILQSSPHARSFGPNVVPRPGFPLATGGRIAGPGGPFDDTAGLFRLSNGEGVINAGAMRAFDTMHPRLFDDYINRGRLPANDNGWQSVVSELRALRTENSVMQAQIAALIAKGDKSNVDAIERQSRNSQSDARDMNGKQQARQRRRVING